MKVNINRIAFYDYCTIGELYINGKFNCYTLEDTIRLKKIKGVTAISEGTYKLDLRYSPKFSPKYGHDMIWVKEVPNFEFILIHKGNLDTQTEGCLLVGDSRGFINQKQAVLYSASAYERIYPIIADAIEQGEAVEITYKNIKTEIV